MKVELSYNEIEEFLLSHYGKKISATYVSRDTVCIGMEIDVWKFSKVIEMNVTVENINGNDIYLYYSSPTRGLNLMAKGGIIMLSSKLKEKLPMVDFIDDNRVHLSSIEKMKDTLDKISLQEVTFASDSIQAVVKLLL